MADFPSPLVAGLRQVVLEKIKFGFTVPLHREFLEDLVGSEAKRLGIEADTVENVRRCLTDVQVLDTMLMDFMLSCKFAVAGQQWVEEPFGRTPIYPNWWEHLKDTVLPSCLKKGWLKPKKQPIATEVRYFYVCPHIDMPKPGPHLEWLASKKRPPHA